jgi:hypothetical protein
MTTNPPAPGEACLPPQQQQVCVDTETIKKLEEGLNKVLSSFSLVAAKEVAAEALEVDVEEYLVQDVDLIMDKGFGEESLEELDFDPEEDFKNTVRRWD